jgi:hypothetical protein
MNSEHQSGQALMRLWGVMVGGMSYAPVVRAP